VTPRPTPVVRCHAVVEGPALLGTRGVRGATTCGKSCEFVDKAGARRTVALWIRGKVVGPCHSDPADVAVIAADFADLAPLEPLDEPASYVESVENRWAKHALTDDPPRKNGFSPVWRV
jgi:hypothetical protein